jgi:translocation and assembly module TamB
VNGEVVDAVIRTGDFVPLTVKGRYGKDTARISGFFDFSGSDLLEPVIARIGRTAKFGFAISPTPTGTASRAWPGG